MLQVEAARNCGSASADCRSVEPCSLLDESSLRATGCQAGRGCETSPSRVSGVACRCPRSGSTASCRACRFADRPFQPSSRPPRRAQQSEPERRLQSRCGHPTSSRASISGAPCSTRRSASRRIPATTATRPTLSSTCSATPRSGATATRWCCTWTPRRWRRTVKNPTRAVRTPTATFPRERAVRRAGRRQAARDRTRRGGRRRWPRTAASASGRRRHAVSPATPPPSRCGTARMAASWTSAAGRPAFPRERRGRDGPRRRRPPAAPRLALPLCGFGGYSRGCRSLPSTRGSRRRSPAHLPRLRTSKPASSAGWSARCSRPVG